MRLYRLRLITTDGAIHDVPFQHRGITRSFFVATQVAADKLGMAALNAMKSLEVFEDTHTEDEDQ